MDIRNAIEKAVIEKADEVVLNLLKTGIDLKENGFGTQLLVAAATNLNGEKIIEYLLDYGAEPDHDMLTYVCRRPYDGIIVEKILKHGATPTVNSSQIGIGNALHEAAKSSPMNLNGNSKICEVLLKYGADVDKDCYLCNTTPLYYAIENENNDVIEVLLQYGANPLKEYKGPACPLQKIFSLTAPVIEMVIKYASLQVDHEDDKNVFEFLAHFRGEKSNDSRSRLYFPFATKCLGEIKTLKQHWFKDHKSTLFDFVVSQGNALNSFLGNASVVNQVFKLLSTLAVPIYSEVILKKLERNTVIDKVLEFSYQKWSVVSHCKKVYIDTSIVECISKFLNNKDLRHFFLAFAFPQ